MEESVQGSDPQGSCRGSSCGTGRMPHFLNSQDHDKEVIRRLTESVAKAMDCRRNGIGLKHLFQTHEATLNFHIRSQRT